MHGNTDLDNTILKAIKEGEQTLSRFYFISIIKNYVITAWAYWEMPKKRKMLCKMLCLFVGKSTENQHYNIIKILFVSIRTQRGFKNYSNTGFRTTPYASLDRIYRVFGKSEFSEDELLKLQKIEQAIDELPSQCKNVFLMSFIDKKSYKQIADELAISLNTVKTHVSKAYRIIREKAQNLENLTLFIWFYFRRIQ